MTAFKFSIVFLSTLLTSACGGGGSSSGGGQAQESAPSGLATHCVQTVQIAADQVRFTNTCMFRINVNIFRVRGTTFFGLDPNESAIDGLFNDGEVVACEAPRVPAQGPSGPFCQT